MMEGGGLSASLDLFHSDFFSTGHGRDEFEQGIHAVTGFEDGVYFVVTAAIGMEHEDARTFMRLFDHVRQVMTVVARESWPENDKVECVAFELLFDGFASLSGGDVVPSFLNGSSLGRKNVGVSFAVKDLKFGFRHDETDLPFAGSARTVAIG